MGPKETPLEAGLGFAVSWEKDGGFIGRDALLRQRQQGIEKRLVSFLLPKTAWPSGHHPIYRDGHLAGEITSGAPGPTIDKAVALGWLEHGSMNADDILSDTFAVEIGGSKITATPSLKAPYDPSGERLKS